jgi:hypothetical protein
MLVCFAENRWHHYFNNNVWGCAFLDLIRVFSPPGLARKVAAEFLSRNSRPAALADRGQPAVNLIAAKVPVVTAESSCRLNSVVTIVLDHPRYVYGWSEGLVSHA